jgi:orotidine-5'-phosphate decarboxylase
LQVLGVTVLTSLDDADLQLTGASCDRHSAVSSRLKLCHDAGLHGAVVAAGELPLTRDLAPGFLRVVPGIRAPGTALQDHKRTADAAAAMQAGASLLVVGRPVVASADPRREVQALLTLLGGPDGRA